MRRLVFRWCGDVFAFGERLPAGLSKTKQHLLLSSFIVQLIFPIFFHLIDNIRALITINWVFNSYEHIMHNSWLCMLGWQYHPKFYAPCWTEESIMQCQQSCFTAPAHTQSGLWTEYLGQPQCRGSLKTLSYRSQSTNKLNMMGFNLHRVSIKTCHFIFYYNSCVSWLLFITFVLLVVGMNTLQPLIIYLPNSLMMS